MVDKPCTELPNPEAAVLPALVSVFDSEVTLLGHFIHSAYADKNEQWPGPRGYVLSSDKPYFLAMLAWPISHLRNQKLGVPTPHGYSRFGTVSSESYWQALSYVFDCAFHG